jgi:hypothetical protein
MNAIRFTHSRKLKLRDLIDDAISEGRAKELR